MTLVKSIIAAGVAVASLAVVHPAFACDAKSRPTSLLGQTFAKGIGLAGSPQAVAAQKGIGPMADTPAPEKIVGLWLGTATVAGQPLLAYEMFTSDGLEVLYDAGPPSAGNVCLGVWASGPGHVIKVTHPAWSYGPDGSLVGTVVIGSKITIDPDGNHFHGTVTVDVYDQSATLVDHEEGTITARRITVQ